MDEKLKRDAASPIRIRLKGGDGTNHYRPGDTLSGVIQIHPDTTIQCRSVEYRVGWRTEGKGRRNEGIVQEKHFDITEINPASPFYEQFDVQLPRSPWSYAGHFINIVWSVQVKVDIALAKDYNEEYAFIVQP